MLPIWYHSDETGAPALNNTAGSLIALLDALLITGFNVKAVTSVSVSAGVATAVISAHGYEVGKTLLISGATPSGLNGNRVITAVVDANTVRWAAVGVPDGAASGSITAKRAPLGWVKAFAGTNVAMYARTDPQATGMLLRVDDTAAGVASSTFARAIMVETAGGVDTYTAPAPTASQMSGGVYVCKGVNSAAAKKWVAVGDGRTLYFFSDSSSYTFASYGGLHSFAFGDVQTWRAGDAYHCMIMGGASNDTTYFNRSTDSIGTQSDGLYLARLSNQVGAAVTMTFQGRAFGFIGQQNTAGGGVYPSPVDNGMPIDRSVLVRENNYAAGHPYRGTARGCVAPVAQVPNALHLQTLSNLDGTTDSFLVVCLTSTVSVGAMLFNISSDWGG